MNDVPVFRFALAFGACGACGGVAGTLASIFSHDQRMSIAASMVGGALAVIFVRRWESTVLRRAGIPSGWPQTAHQRMVHAVSTMALVAVTLLEILVYRRTDNRLAELSVALVLGAPLTFMAFRAGYETLPPANALELSVARKRGYLTILSAITIVCFGVITLRAAHRRSDDALYEFMVAVYFLTFVMLPIGVYWQRKRYLCYRHAACRLHSS